MSLCSTRCGDETVAGDEECDDGGTQDNDGCSSLCKLECGDGLLQPEEQCDDSNLVPNDGCSPDCFIEPGFLCPAPGQLCISICGDGIVTSKE